MVFKVILLEREIGDPQRDRNRSNCIVDPSATERMSMDCFVLHAQVPRTEHTQERNSQPRRQYFATHHSENREPINRDDNGERTPLTSPIEG